jgi:phage terminase large subunit-like protein
LLGGRGAGKTRAGSEWVRAVARCDPHVAGDSGGRIALVGETIADARAVMIEGESGLLAVHARDARPQWNPSKRELAWANGAIGRVYSASDPEGLRGSQFGAAWCDEIAKWSHPDETWDMLQFCMRLGSGPRIVATTTPKPIALLGRILADRQTAVTRAATQANRHFLSPGFLDHLAERYGGTRLGRQEIDGEMIEDREDGLWRREAIESRRVAAAPALNRIVVAVDPPAGAGRNAASCGIVAAGEDGKGNCYVLADCTLAAAAPAVWAARAVALYRELGADCLVAETNQGGDMVRAVIRHADPAVPVRAVSARRGKWLRAEPVAMLYESGRVFHAGRFPELEDEMCAFGPDGLASGKSPDRVDALVWALGELALGRRALPRVRGV